MIVGILSIATQVAYSFCLDDISVNVFIFVPKGAEIDKLHLYSNIHEPAVFEQTPWYLKNKDKIMTFDIEDASAEPEAKLCSPKHICPTASNKTFLGCDLQTEKCVCKRGWQFDNRKQVCVDVDECELGRCPPSMSCTNIQGSFACSCLDGTFWNGDSCQRKANYMVSVF
ncbi:fibulin-1-like [Watersipora subatra]|uniref:fibulin-1-like n=1 Tax=Watersipora subatra TaxID=2589382 RepID=UPI00355B39CA